MQRDKEVRTPNEPFLKKKKKNLSIKIVNKLKVNEINFDFHNCNK